MYSTYKQVYSKYKQVYSNYRQAYSNYKQMLQFKLRKSFMCDPWHIWGSQSLWFAITVALGLRDRRDRQTLLTSASQIWLRVLKPRSNLTSGSQTPSQKIDFGLSNPNQIWLRALKPRSNLTSGSQAQVIWLWGPKSPSGLIDGGLSNQVKFDLGGGGGL